MNNNVMAAAMSDIDDKLITDAEHQTALRPNLRVIYSVTSLAACLVLIFSLIMFTGFGASSEITLYGNKVSSEAILIETPAPASFRTNAVLEIPLDVEVRKDLNLKTSDGTIEVFKKGTDNLLFAGDNYNAEESVSLVWTIESPLENKTYELTLNDKDVISVVYDRTHSCWTIQKTK